MATFDGIKQPSKKPAHGVMVPPSDVDTAALVTTDKNIKAADAPVSDPVSDTASNTASNTAAAAADMMPAGDVPAAPKAAPATIWRSADKLLGLAAEELQIALGAPARIRDEETGRIYQYVGSDCVLDLFLYQEAAGSYRVSYAEARSINAEKKPVDICLKSLPAPIVADNTPSS